MLIPALRRFVQLLVVIGVATIVLSTLFGLLVGASLLHSIAVGFYLVGCFVLLGAFFFANRGPVRPSGDTVSGGLFGLGSRRLRWATREEQEATINSAAVMLPLGLLLILVGVAWDTHHALF